MRKRIRLPIIVSVAALWIAAFGLWNQVFAQQQGAGENGGIDVTVRADKSMNPQEQLAWVNEQQTAIQTTARRVESLLDRARNEKDPIKISCLDDKLTQINVNKRGIEERTEAFSVAVKGGDTKTANQQFEIIKIYVSRIQGLNAEADNCMGESDIVLGKTETTLTIDDSITMDDPSADLKIDDVGVDQPAVASGYY